MKICYIFRNPQGQRNSIEKTFRLIAHDLTDEEVDLLFLPGEGASLIAIIKNVFYCLKLRRSDYDVFHITGPDNYIALVLPRRKTVLSIHDLGLVFDCSGIKKLIAKTFWYNLPTRFAAIVTANSSKTLKELRDNIPGFNRTVELIPPPIPNDYKPDNRSFNEKTPVVLQVGTLKRKNLERVIEAIKDTHCQLRIIGRLSEEQCSLLYKYKINYSNSFQITDEQMLSEYRNCDLVTFVSTYEGFGIPVVEAQAMGKAVVTSNIEPMNTVAGSDACKVDPYDVASIREAINEVINNKEYRDRIIEDGIRNSSQFLAHNVADKYYQTYKKIVCN